MTSKSQLILHVATEAFVIATLSIFFTKKINTLNKSIDEMTTHIQLVESKLEEQEKFIHMLSDKLVQLEFSSRQPEVKTPPQPEVSRSSPVSTPQPEVSRSSPVSTPQPEVSRSSSVFKRMSTPQPVREEVILLNLFNPRQKNPLSKPVIEIMDDEKSVEQLDTEIQDELLDLVGELSPIKEEEED